MAQNPNMAMANRPPGQPGMNPAQQQHQQQLATANRSFIQRLQMFLQQRNIPLDPNPMVAGRPILLYQLYQLIQRAGGSRQVTMRTQWAQVAQALGFPGAAVSHCSS
ncbi:hypothetical protein MRB53_040992 [Persea americana]|nr:hypothetical protein MRB53_040992 [Persea americana]